MLAGEHYGGSPLPPGVFAPTSGRINVADAYHRPVAYERISPDPGRMSGLPCIRDTRVTVASRSLPSSASWLRVVRSSRFSTTTRTWSARTSSQPCSSPRSQFRSVSFHSLDQHEVFR